MTEEQSFWRELADTLFAASPLIFVGSMICAGASLGFVDTYIMDVSPSLPTKQISPHCECWCDSETKE